MVQIELIKLIKLKRNQSGGSGYSETLIFGETFEGTKYKAQGDLFLDLTKLIVDFYFRSILICST